jgi:RNA polymerase sigma-B factor
MRFEHDMTQVEIGAAIGVSQMQISRIIRQALQRLREAADQREPLPA